MSTPYSTIPLPDGVVIGGEWPFTIITWPGGKSRGATRPEADLWRALEKAERENSELRAALELGQINCDAVYDDLRKQRDILREQLQVCADWLARSVRAADREISEDARAAIAAATGGKA